MSKLYIVGTPIGNLQDITLRAIETLKKVSYIACEDTRHSLPLLNKYDIRKKLISYHKFNEAICAEKIIDIILNGEEVALISDAGMPSISDPGAELISRCHDVGIKVEVIPGPTALASAIALSGVKSTGFCFLGFLPEKTTEKTAIISRVAGNGLPIVLYTAPHDVKKTAKFLFETLGDRKVYLARELTKLYETLTITTLAEFDCEQRGEMVMIIEGAESENPLNSLSVEEHILHYMSLGKDKKSAVKKVASDRKVHKNEIYQESISLK